MGTDKPVGDTWPVFEFMVNTRSRQMKIFKQQTGQGYLTGF
jgi:hypothetical protein